MDLKHLRVFVEVANSKGFARAAEKLHIAQAAISTSIRKLEEELGVVLLNRGERKISLTAEGKVLTAHARELGLAVNRIARDPRKTCFSIKPA